jgi:hypothetical protein
MPRRISRGLLVKSPHIDRILARRKTWEIRGARAHIREVIALIRSGSGEIVGTCEIVDVVGPMTLADYKQNARKAGLASASITRLPYAKTFAWVLKNVKAVKKPRPYKHPPGAAAVGEVTALFRLMPFECSHS